VTPSSVPAPESAPAFDINPEVVFRLGDELITDELQALVELVKNSYDASATSVVVHIDTTTPVTTGISADDDSDTSADDDSHPQPIGWLEVRDNGDGMNRKQLEDGWLLISTLNKREMKDKDETNRLGRTPLGDKGLGRLGVLRIGAQVEIRTRPRSAPEENILAFSRADFMRQHALSDVHPRYEQRALKRDKDAPGGWGLESAFDADVTCEPVRGRQGTIIRVTALAAPDVWTDRVRIQQQMLSLVSPFHEIDQFNLAVYLDDPTESEPLSIGQIAELRRDLADTRWSFKFEKSRLQITGRIKLGAFKPSPTNERLAGFWSSHVEPDRGAEFRRRLKAGALKAHDIKTSKAPWWLTITLTVGLSDVPRPGASTRYPDRDGKPTRWADPGPFVGELDSFSLARDVEIDSSVFESNELYGRWVRDVRGVKVFRDGFGIRVNDDFLRLGTGFTGGRSFWTLRPGNVVGYIKLSARENAQLKETTDREGFVVNGAYETFAALMKTLVDRINITQTQIGRELTTWAEASAPPAVEPPSRKAAELARAVAERDERTRETVASVASVQKMLTELGEGSALITTEQMSEAREASELLSRLQQLTAEGETLRRDLDELGRSSQEVERERAQLRDQLRAAYQTVGLGIVAEMVAHEMTGITGRLQARADALGRQFKGPEQRAARALASEVKSAVRAIRLQLRHLEPQLRYQRARREDVDVRQLAEDVADYHRTRLSPSGIDVKVTGKGLDTRVNRGRLQQALDNLVINSEFWLKHDDTKRPQIDITIKPPMLIVRDNGPGVDPGLETAIFEPFVSGRAGDEGRGLGLFIARQVLNDDSVTIYLGEPEQDGRRRSFVLDFAGAISEA
jgi:signal transduction histidine kinase